MNESFLIPPRKGDGTAGIGELLSAADEIREEIDGPIRDAKSGARRDCISYFVHNAFCAAADSIDVRRAINIRWNLKWTEVDEILRAAQEPAKKAIEREKTKRSLFEQQQSKFADLVALFDPIQVLKNDSDPTTFDLIGLSGDQLRTIAKIIREGDERVEGEAEGENE